MQKTAIRVIALLGMLLLVLLTAIPNNTYAKGVAIVQDQSGILTSEQIQELEDYGKRLYKATDAELAVLISPTTDGKSIESYALDKLREFQLGDREKNNGALFIVTTGESPDDERFVRLEVGYGLEGALPDGKVGRIIDDVAMPYLRNDQPDLAIMEAYKVFYNEIAAEYGLEGEELPVATFDDEDSGGGFPIVPVLVIGFILLQIFLNSKGGGGGSGGSGGRRSGGPIFIPGGFGGGSSGSGGGFGGFGGGGSGGGGGAGRSW